VDLSQVQLGDTSRFSAEYVKIIEAGERIPPAPTVIRLPGSLILHQEELAGLIRSVDTARQEGPSRSGKEIATIEPTGAVTTQSDGPTTVPRSQWM
jgi:hypothetical protein